MKCVAKSGKAKEPWRKRVFWTCQFTTGMVGLVGWLVGWLVWFHRKPCRTFLLLVDGSLGIFDAPPECLCVVALPSCGTIWYENLSMFRTSMFVLPQLPSCIVLEFPEHFFFRLASLDASYNVKFTFYHWPLIKIYNKVKCLFLKFLTTDWNFAMKPGIIVEAAGEMSSGKSYHRWPCPLHWSNIQILRIRKY